MQDQRIQATPPPMGPQDNPLERILQALNYNPQAFDELPPDRKQAVAQLLETMGQGSPEVRTNTADQVMGILAGGSTPQDVAAGSTPPRTLNVPTSPMSPDQREMQSRMAASWAGSPNG